MECPGRDAELIDWILAELSADEARKLAQHVEQCPQCAHSLGRWREVHQALAEKLMDRQMPARLVFLKPKRLATGFLNSVWRTAALAAVGAVVFLGISLGGLAHWMGRLSTREAAEKTALTQAELKALTARAVEEQLSLQRKELEAANEKLVARLREEQMRNLASLARHLQYLESAQSTVWKETQQQSALVALIARNSFEPKAPPLTKP